MSFVLEIRKNGKDIILYNNNKYRESYPVKSGDIVWRCLGKSCKAFVKTNKEKTVIYSASESHSGQHPVTMRAQRSTPPLQRRTPRLSTPVAQNSPTPSHSKTDSIQSMAPNQPQSVSCSTPRPITPIPAPLTELEAENTSLKEQLTIVKGQLNFILDHSIESDSRLLQYTDQIFVNNTSRAVAPHPTTANCAVQCDLQPATCQLCVDSLDLVAGLRTTIEVLEAEVKCLRAEKKELEFGVKADNWTLLESKKKHASVLTQNRFLTLQIDEPDNCKSLYSTAPIQEKKRKPRQGKKTGGNRHESVPKKGKGNGKSTLPEICHSFPLMQIEGDSHARHLASLLQEKVSSKTKVRGMCKPGAGLLSVTSGNPPPPGSCTLLIAGTNDIAGGDSSTIFKHLEEVISSRLAPASSIIISTLPVRHDLPAGHPVHLQTALVNNFIEDLCNRMEGVQILNFNCIGRYFFTQHGMHLRQAGRRILAGLVLKCMQRASSKVGQKQYTPRVTVSKPTEPPSTPGASSAASSAAQPSCLPYDSFADAVRRPMEPSKNLSPAKKLTSR